MNARYTNAHIAIFERMFSIVREYDVYRKVSLTPYGATESENYDEQPVSEEARIKLSNGNEYSILFGQSSDAEGIAFDVFDHFIFELNQDEDALETYLKEESSFIPEQ